MIILKTDAQVEIIRRAGKIVAETLQMIEKEIKPGVKTSRLDQLAEDFIRSKDAKPGFKGYGGFPGTACISVDDEVVHGIPGNRELKEGQIVGIDLGAIVDGYYGDSAATFPVGEISEDKKRLLEVTKRSLYSGLDKVKAGGKLGLVSNTIQTIVEEAGYSVVRDLVGHGIGKKLHEDPQIPHFGSPDSGPTLEKGMVLAIEPMVNMGDYKIKQRPDGWTIVTADGSVSAHFEHTVAVTDDGADILTSL